MWICVTFFFYSYLFKLCMTEVLIFNLKQLNLPLLKLLLNLKKSKLKRSALVLPWVVVLLKSSVVLLPRRRLLTSKKKSMKKAQLNMYLKLPNLPQLLKNKEKNLLLLLLLLYLLFKLLPKTNSLFNTFYFCLINSLPLTLII